MSERADNRATFPFAASVVDDLRAVFGADVKLIYAEENGRAIGKENKCQGVVPARVLHPVSELDSMNIKAARKKT